MDRLNCGATVSYSSSSAYGREPELEGGRGGGGGGGLPLTAVLQFFCGDRWVESRQAVRPRGPLDRVPSLVERAFPRLGFALSPSKSVACVGCVGALLDNVATLSPAGRTSTEKYPFEVDTA